MSEKQFEEVANLALSLTPVEKIRLVERLAATLEQELAATTPTSRRSLYGLWAD